MVHRRIGDLDVHLVVNTGPHRRTQRVVPRDTRSRLEVWDPARRRRRRRDQRPRTERDRGRARAVPGAGPGRPRRRPVDGRATERGGSEPTGTPSARRRLATRPPRRHRPGRGVAPPPLGGRPADRAGLLRHAGLRHHDHRIPPHAGPIRLDLGEGRPADDGGAGRERGIEGHSYRVQLVPPVGEVVRVLVDGVVSATLWAPPYTCDLTDQLHGRSCGDAAAGGVQHHGQRPGGGRHRRPAGWPTRSAGTVDGSGCRPSSGCARAWRRGC